MRKRYYIFFFLLFACIADTVCAQQREVESIPNQPSPEAYNLLKDSKGYIWVAHEFGVSRYDGANFINLQHPRQSSLSLTGLLEDSQGRIWCHNFSGQIFYIENLQLNLLEAYSYQDEHHYPRLAICGDELIATSKKGLFVYNLLNGKSTYHSIKFGSSTLTQIGNKIVCYNGYDFFCYEKGKAVVKLSFNDPIPDHLVTSLQNVSLKDTFYLIVNPNGIYYKLSLTKNNINIHDVVKTGGFINTITRQGDNIWINTKEHSFTTNGKDSIAGMNLSDVITDNQGNRWMSSLKRGLCVQYNTQVIKKLNDSLAIGEQSVRRIHTEGNTLFFGMSSGKVYKMTPSGKLQYVLSVPKEAGAIERITSFYPDHLFVAASVGSYAYNYITNTLQQLPVSITAKDAAVKEKEVYVASTYGIKQFSLQHLAVAKPQLATKPLFEKPTRTRSITILHDTIVVAYSDGVFMIHQNKLSPLRYNGYPIYATTVRTVGSKLLIATYNQGLLIFENGRFQNITVKDGLTSNFIKDIKTINGATWLIYTDRFQLLNKDMTGVEANSYSLSKGGFNDFSALANNVYFSTSDGLYTMQLTRPSEFKAQTYIDNISANGIRLVSAKKLNHLQNHLQFQVSTPYFVPQTNIIYQYRIKDLPSSQWQQGAPGQTAFNIVALEPGVYDLEIKATDENRNDISKPAFYHFEIMPPWYQRWWFRAVMGLLLVALVCGSVWLFYRRRLHKQRLAFEKQLAIQEERQRISAEIHDDVGAGLLAMRLLTEMTKNKLPESEAKKEVEKIHTSIGELSHKMKEVVWSLNTENDQLSNLLLYIRRQAIALFENSPILLRVLFPTEEIPAFTIHGEKRRHIYLAVKEALHNCLKHSEARTCTLGIRIEGSTLFISVTDDGKGFVALQKQGTGNGLNGMKRRMQQIEGVLEVETKEQTSVQFMVPLNENI